MRIEIIAVGRLKAGPESELSMRYVERIAGLSRGLGLSGLKAVELPESQGRRDADRKADEAKAILAALEPAAFVIALDERGRSPTSQDFAARLERQRDEGRKTTQFVIGGADGLDDSVRGRTDWLISFGAMTMPHQLVRVLLLEQIYRACTILSVTRITASDPAALTIS